MLTKMELESLVFIHFSSILPSLSLNPFMLRLGCSKASISLHCYVQTLRV